MATNPAPNYLYSLAEDLYRLGSSTSPRLDNVRHDDIDAYDRNGVIMVRSNGLGISLGTLEYLQLRGMSGWVWKVPTRVLMPVGLALRPDPNPRNQGHYFLCPSSDMTISDLALHCERTRKT